MLSFVLYLKGKKMCLGTINENTALMKKTVEPNSVSLHADLFRDKGWGRFSSATSFFFWIINPNAILFTSNPRVLKCSSFFSIKDLRSKRSDNIRWVKLLADDDILEITPKYFHKHPHPDFARFEVGHQRARQVLLSELSRYDERRFLPE
jgi:hypothetical protein